MCSSLFSPGMQQCHHILIIYWWQNHILNWVFFKYVVAVDMPGVISIMYLAACVLLSVNRWPTVSLWTHTQLDHHCLCLFQGMNFIAGYLIIITKDEEKSFWLMDALLGRMLPGKCSNTRLRSVHTPTGVFNYSVWLEVRSCGSWQGQTRKYMRSPKLM